MGRVALVVSKVLCVFHHIQPSARLSGIWGFYTRLYLAQ